MDTHIGSNELSEFFKQRKKTIIIIFLLIFVTVTIVALWLPPIYRAETTILRESQQVSEDYIRSMNTSYAEERLNAATQQVMSRSNLLKIIEMYDLYAEMRERKKMSEIIAKMRNSIELETLYAKVTNERTGRFTAINTAFKLSYEGKDPLKVQKVTNTLSSLYIELEMLTRGKRASATTTFFENELQNLKEQIRVNEEKLRVFKEQHHGELPENYATNVRALDRLEAEFDRLENRIRTLEERKLFIQGQMATIDPLLPIETDEGTLVVNPGERLKRLRLKLMSLQSTLSEKHPDIIRLKNEISELEQEVGKSDAATLKIKRLKELETEYAAQKSKLGSKHPDIIRLEKEIKVMSAEVDQLITEKLKSEVAEERPDNPTYINLKTQLFIVEADIKNLSEDRDEVKQSIEKYRTRIENAPLVEKEYSELTRDYKSTKRKYDDISNKLMEARVAKGMEESQFSERFVIVDPAALPEIPYKPKRAAIIILGLILALGIAIGFAVIQESMDRSIKNVDELNYLTDGSVFSVISYIETDEERRLRRIKHMAWGAGAAGIIVAALVVVDHFIIPLDNLWIEIKNRIVSI